jgi:hypothetical protein
MLALVKLGNTKKPAYARESPFWQIAPHAAWPMAAGA